MDLGEPGPLAGGPARLSDHLRGLRGADVSRGPDHGGEGPFKPLKGMLMFVLVSIIIIHIN